MWGLMDKSEDLSKRKIIERSWNSERVTDHNKTHTHSNGQFPLATKI